MRLRAVLFSCFVCALCACERPAGCQRAPATDDAPEGRVVAQPQPARQRWLRDHFLADHRMLLGRAPEDTQGKFLKMAQSPYNYFRGSANMALRDATEQDNALFDPSVPAIWLVGDPHPENFGTFRLPQGRMTLEVNDFDATLKGPYLWDIHRLSVGFGVLWAMARDQGLLGDEDLEPLLKVLVAAYLDELQQTDDALFLRQSFASKEGASAHAGAIYADLIRRASKDGDKREALSDYTTRRAGQPALRRGVLEPSDHPLIARDVLTDPPAHLSDLPHTTRQAYLQTLLPARRPASLGQPLDVASRLGAGVGSYPVQRLYVLYPSDLLLEYKEILAPFVPSGFQAPTATSPAQRAVDAQRAMHSSPQSDLWLGHVQRDGASFKVRQRTKYQKGIKVTRLLDEAKQGGWSMQDLHAFAQVSARILARAHTRANPQPVRPALAHLRANLQDIEHSLLRSGVDATVQTLRDYELFVDLLTPEGSMVPGTKVP